MHTTHLFSPCLVFSFPFDLSNDYVCFLTPVLSLLFCLPVFLFIAWNMAGGNHLSPWAPDISTCARSLPAFSALSRHTVHQVSIRFAADMTVMGRATAATRPWTTNCSTRYLPASMVTCARSCATGVEQVIDMFASWFLSYIYGHVCLCMKCATWTGTIRHLPVSSQCTESRHTSAGSMTNAAAQCRAATRFPYSSTELAWCKLQQRMAYLVFDKAEQGVVEGLELFRLPD